MELVLFFLDTFLWYVIWNAVFSISRSFSLGLLIWTLWADIYTLLPKRIYATLLTRSDMEVEYKPQGTRAREQSRVFLADHRHRCSYRKSGMPSSCPCTANTYSPSITFKKLLYQQVQSDPPPSSASTPPLCKRLCTLVSNQRAEARHYQGVGLDGRGGAEVSVAAELGEHKCSPANAGDMHGVSFPVGAHEHLCLYCVCIGTVCGSCR